jgi:hypothetical protein
MNASLTRFLLMIHMQGSKGATQGDLGMIPVTIRASNTAAQSCTLHLRFVEGLCEVGALRHEAFQSGADVHHHIIY